MKIKERQGGILQDEAECSIADRDNKSTVLFFLLNPTRTNLKLFVFQMSQSTLETHTLCLHEMWLSWLVRKRHTSLSLHPICLACVYFN